MREEKTEFELGQTEGGSRPPEKRARSLGRGGLGLVGFALGGHGEETRLEGGGNGEGFAPLQLDILFICC